MAEAQLAEELLAQEQEVYAKPGLSIELRVILAAVVYGVVVGSLLTSLAWWLAT
jgi:hypothetical protein